MFNRRLGIVSSLHVGRLLLLAAMAAGAWAMANAAQPLPLALAQPQQSMGTAAKAVARQAAAPKGATATATAPANRETDQAMSGATTGGRRDPFLVPKEAKGGADAVPDEMMDAQGGGPLPPGKRGLFISQLRLEGVVRQSSGKPMIAVVTNNTNRAYFLRENDEVYNGVVSKITPDSIYFTENVRTPDGQASSREVIKRLGSGPGENR